jgi:hypothetical protein
MKKRIAALIIAPIVGAILGFLLALAIQNGWFKSNWQMIEKPPVTVQVLTAIHKDSLWIEDASGTLYFNENSSTCESDCWVEVSELPVLPFLEANETKVKGEACAPALPLGRVVARLSECRIEQWVDKNFIFALRKDGNIYLWQANLYGEWTFVLLFLGICFGSVSLFVVTLAVVLFFQFIKRSSIKQKEAVV